MKHIQSIQCSFMWTNYIADVTSFSLLFFSCPKCQQLTICQYRQSIRFCVASQYSTTTVDILLHRLFIQRGRWNVILRLWTSFCDYGFCGFHHIEYECSGRAPHTPNVKIKANIDYLNLLILFSVWILNIRKKLNKIKLFIIFWMREKLLSLSFSLNIFFP